MRGLEGKTEDGGRRAEDGGRKSEERGAWSREQGAGSGKLKTEGGGRKVERRKQRTGEVNPRITQMDKTSEIFNHQVTKSPKGKSGN